MAPDDANVPLWTRLNPLHAVHWDRHRARGRQRFVLTWGILAIGVPAALLVAAAALWLTDNQEPLASVANALEVTFIGLLVAPVAGVLAANAWWERREGRMYDRSGAPADAAEIIEVAPVAPDAQQRTLAALETRLGALARSDPKRLSREIIAMTVLGYGYVLLVVALLVGMIVLLVHFQGTLGAVARQGAWILGWFTVFVLSALNVRILQPTGRRVTRAGSPALFDTLGTIERRLDAPAPDVVLIDSDLNAAVSEIPRFGIFGLPKRYLTIGLPLLEALPPDEATAILAHEMAHLSRRHALRGAWAARLGVTWRGLAASLEAGRHWARPLFLPFFRWYAPRFELYAQAVSRRDEHESDALAADCVGGAIAARALLRVHVYQRFLSERLLPAVYRQSLDRSEPPAGVLEELGAALRAGPSPEDLARWTHAQLSTRTLGSHSHPSIGERVARLTRAGPASEASLVNELSAPRSSSGADALLGSARVPKLRLQVEHDWQVATLDMWRRLHTDARVWRDAARQDGFEVEMPALWAHARWATECEPREVALPLVREVLKRVPAHVEAKITLGRLLSESDDSTEQGEGVATLETAMRRDTGLALVACAALEAYYERMELREDVARVQTRARQLNGELLARLGECRHLAANDPVEAYPLPAASLESLRQACARRQEVSRAFLVRKRTRFLREQPCVMLAVECGVPWYKPSTGRDAIEAARALLERIVLPETADLLVLPVEPRGALVRRLAGVRDALIYERVRG